MRAQLSRGLQPFVSQIEDALAVLGSQIRGQLQALLSVFSAVGALHLRPRKNADGSCDGIKIHATVQQYAGPPVPELRRNSKSQNRERTAASGIDTLRRVTRSRGLGPFMNKGKSAEYRANAVECMKLAAAANGSETKLIFLNMAEAWLRLADRIELSKSYQTHEGVGSGKSPDESASREGNRDQDREA